MERLGEVFRDEGRGKRKCGAQNHSKDPGVGHTKRDSQLLSFDRRLNVEMLQCISHDCGGICVNRRTNQDTKACMASAMSHPCFCPRGCLVLEINVCRCGYPFQGLMLLLDMAERPAPIKHSYVAQNRYSEGLVWKR